MWSREIIGEVYFPQAENLGEKGLVIYNALGER